MLLWRELTDAHVYYKAEATYPDMLSVFIEKEN